MLPVRRGCWRAAARSTIVVESRVFEDVYLVASLLVGSGEDQESGRISRFRLRHRESRKCADWNAGERIGGVDGAAERGVGFCRSIDKAAVAELDVAYRNVGRSVRIGEAEAHLCDYRRESQSDARPVCW